MSNPRLIKISKFLSRYLRHKPAEIGIKLGAGGWVAVDELLTACANYKFPITLAELKEVVATNDKKRFSFDATLTLIRANQGHSIEVDLQLEPAIPPNVLYHGTGSKSVDAIIQTGIAKMSRHHVHLSSDFKTAKMVGARHGKPVILRVDTGAMYTAGYIFYCADNGVWLVDYVPPEYLKVLRN